MQALMVALLAALLEPSSPDDIRLLSPNGGEHWMIGEMQSIRWSAVGASAERVYIYLLVKNDDGDWIPAAGLGSSPSRHGSFAITPANIQAGETRIRISNNPNEIRGRCLDPSVGDPKTDCPPPRRFTYLFDDSDSQFMIGGAGLLSLQKPASPLSNIVSGETAQIVASFDVEVTGENVILGGALFGLKVSGSPGALRDLTNMRLLDTDGVALAGPENPTDTGSYGSVTFDRPFTLRLGVSTIFLSADVGPAFRPGQAIEAYLDPITDLKRPAGEISGKPLVTRPTKPLFGQGSSVGAAASQQP